MSKAFKIANVKREMTELATRVLKNETKRVETKRQAAMKAARQKALR